MLLFSPSSASASSSSSAPSLSPSHSLCPSDISMSSQDKDKETLSSSPFPKAKANVTVEKKKSPSSSSSCLPFSFSVTSLLKRIFKNSHSTSTSSVSPLHFGVCPPKVPTDIPFSVISHSDIKKSKSTAKGKLSPIPEGENINSKIPTTTMIPNSSSNSPIHYSNRRPCHIHISLSNSPSDPHRHDDSPSLSKFSGDNTYISPPEKEYKYQNILTLQSMPLSIPMPNTLITFQNEKAHCNVIVIREEEEEQQEKHENHPTVVISSPTVVNKSNLFEPNHASPSSSASSSLAFPSSPVSVISPLSPVSLPKKSRHLKKYIESPCLSEEIITEMTFNTGEKEKARKRKDETMESKRIALIQMSVMAMENPIVSPRSTVPVSHSVPSTPRPSNSFSLLFPNVWDGITTHYGVSTSSSSSSSVEDTNKDTHHHSPCSSTKSLEYCSPRHHSSDKSLSHYPIFAAYSVPSSPTSSRGNSVLTFPPKTAQLGSQNTKSKSFILPSPSNPPHLCLSVGVGVGSLSMDNVHPFEI